MKKFELAMRAAEALIEILNLLLPEAKKELESFRKDPTALKETYVNSISNGSF